MYILLSDCMNPQQKHKLTPQDNFESTTTTYLLSFCFIIFALHHI